MILLHHTLDKNRERIIVNLLRKIPKEIRSYARIPRHDLKESLEYLFDAYIDLLVSKNSSNLKRLFRYIAKTRFAQSFPLSAILQALLSFSYELRLVLQDEFRKTSGDGRALFNCAMELIDKTTSESIFIFSDVYQNYVKSQIDDYNQYLNEQNQTLGIDLSKLILFRA